MLSTSRTEGAALAKRAAYHAAAANARTKARALYAGAPVLAACPRRAARAALLAPRENDTLGRDYRSALWRLVTLLDGHVQSVQLRAGWDRLGSASTAEPDDDAWVQRRVALERYAKATGLAYDVDRVDGDMMRLVANKSNLIAMRADASYLEDALILSGVADTPGASWALAKLEEAVALPGDTVELNAVLAPLFSVGVGAPRPGSNRARPTAPLPRRLAVRAITVLALRLLSSGGDPTRTAIALAAQDQRPVLLFNPALHQLLAARYIRTTEDAVAALAAQRRYSSNVFVATAAAWRALRQARQSDARVAVRSTAEASTFYTDLGLDAPRDARQSTYDLAVSRERIQSEVADRMAARLGHALFTHIYDDTRLLHTAFADALNATALAAGEPVLVTDAPREVAEVVEALGGQRERGGDRRSYTLPASVGDEMRAFFYAQLKMQRQPLPLRVPSAAALAAAAAAAAPLVLCELVPRERTSATLYALLGDEGEMVHGGATLWTLWIDLELAAPANAGAVAKIAEAAARSDDSREALRKTLGVTGATPTPTTGVLFGRLAETAMRLEATSSGFNVNETLRQVQAVALAVRNEATLRYDAATSLLDIVGVRPPPRHLERDVTEMRAVAVELHTLVDAANQLFDIAKRHLPPDAHVSDTLVTKLQTWMRSNLDRVRARMLGGGGGGGADTPKLDVEVAAFIARFAAAGVIMSGEEGVRLATGLGDEAWHALIAAGPDVMASREAAQAAQLALEATVGDALRREGSAATVALPPQFVNDFNNLRERFAAMAVAIETTRTVNPAAFAGVPTRALGVDEVARMLDSRGASTALASIAERLRARVQEGMDELAEAYRVMRRIDTATPAELGDAQRSIERAIALSEPLLVRGDLVQFAGSVVDALGARWTELSNALAATSPDKAIDTLFPRGRASDLIDTTLIDGIINERVQTAKDVELRSIDEARELLTRRLRYAALIQAVVVAATTGIMQVGGFYALHDATLAVSVAMLVKMPAVRLALLSVAQLLYAKFVPRLCAYGPPWLRRLCLRITTGVYGVVSAAAIFSELARAGVVQAAWLGGSPLEPIFKEPPRNVDVCMPACVAEGVVVLYDPALRITGEVGDTARTHIADVAWHLDCAIKVRAAIGTPDCSNCDSAAVMNELKLARDATMLAVRDAKPILDWSFEFTGAMLRHAGEFVRNVQGVGVVDT